MLNLVAAAAFFVLIHLLISGTRARDALTDRIGEGPYMGLFSLASVIGLVWLALAYGQAQGSPSNAAYWNVTEATRGVQLAIQFVAVLFIVLGLTTRNPGSVRQEAAVERPDLVHGVLRVTRHPFLWGVAIWGLGHLLVNGDRASLVLFAALTILAVTGGASIDAKRRRKLGAAWEAFAGQTSNLPFAAIAQGRQRLRLGELGLWRLALAVGVYLALLFGHPYFTGVPALP